MMKFLEWQAENIMIVLFIAFALFVNRKKERP